MFFSFKTITHAALFPTVCNALMVISETRPWNMETCITLLIQLIVIVFWGVWIFLSRLFFLPPNPLLFVLMLKTTLNPHNCIICSCLVIDENSFYNIIQRKFSHNLLNIQKIVKLLFYSIHIVNVKLFVKSVTITTAPWPTNVKLFVKITTVFSNS